MFRPISLLITFCLASAASCFASAEDAWEVIVPALERSSIEHLHVLPNDDIIVAGHASLATPNFSGIWVARYTKAGEQVWSQEFIGNAYSRTNQLWVDDHRILVAGYHRVRNPVQTDSFGFFAALDTDGNIVWETWLSEEDSSVLVSKFYILNNGDFLLSGQIDKKDRSIRHAPFFARVTPLGEIKWSFYQEPKGDYYDDLPQTKIQARDQDGRRILMESGGPVKEQQNGELHLHIFRRDFMPGNNEIGRCVVVSDGGEQIEGKECARLDRVEFVDAHSLGNIKFRKFPPGGVFADKIEVAKVDHSGAEEWVWRFQTNHKAAITDAIATADGGILGVGYIIVQSEPKYHRYDAIAFRLDGEGNEVWSRVFRSERRDILTRVASLNEDGFVIVGHTGAIARSNWWDPWMLRIGADGAVRSQADIVP